MGVLATELVPSNDITLPSPAYRKLVACALVYKVCKHIIMFISALKIIVTKLTKNIKSNNFTIILKSTNKERWK